MAAPKVFLFNCAIAPGLGTYTFSALTREEARRIVAEAPEGGVTSSIGHAATAAVMSGILGIEVKPNRLNLDLAVGDCAIVLKMKGRVPEGKILSEAEMEEIGFSLVLERKISE